MDNENFEVKELKINGRLFASYTFDSSEILFIKINKTNPLCINYYTEGKFEDFCISVISFIENINFTGAAYLNI